MTADPGVASLIQARSHTLVEMDHEIILTAILLPSADSRRVVVSYKQKYVHQVLVSRIVKLAKEKSVFRWIDHPDMTRAVDWDVKNQKIKSKSNKDTFKAPKNIKVKRSGEFRKHGIVKYRVSAR